MNRYLLDTHVFIWQAIGSSELSQTALDLIGSDHELLISGASIWEMAIKVSIGKLSFTGSFEEMVENEIQANQYQLLPPSNSHFF